MQKLTQRDEVLHELYRVSVRLAEMDTLKRSRIDLLRQGRELDPPLSFSEMAEVMGMTGQGAYLLLKRANAAV